ncbi:MAG: LysM peptidoglycan-binding domain-containing protein [Bacteriovoracaceae bacterium]|nr:LysM peptidoglycan-binding domain-containing protein [Bacteriovoracaceae bacterium]
MAQSQDVESLDLLDSSDVEVLLKEGEKDKAAAQKLDLSELEEVDDLDSLKNDIGETIFKEDKKKEVIEDDDDDDEEEGPSLDLIPDNKPVNESTFNVDDAEKLKGTVIFDVGSEEKSLLETAKYIQGKIPEKEWDEIATAARIEKYTVQEGDWLWKISQKLFGSGFYYSKIWSMNPQITNPHEIEPGMVLVFDTGSSDAMPEVKLGEFVDSELDAKNRGKVAGVRGLFDFQEYGKDAEPPWMKERERLAANGAFFQYISEETYEDIASISKQSLNDEHIKYEPPVVDIVIAEPPEEYDDAGFDKNSKVAFDVKEGFFLNTFLTSNIVQDLGYIEALAPEKVFIQKLDTIYVKFDNSVKVKPGDKFSVYSAEGKSTHPISDREGYRYTITAQIKAMRKINHLWECYVEDLTGLVERLNRITIYTPKINRITKAFSRRNIEAAAIDSYRETAGGSAFGDVLYLDRGRADGVELGTVFEFYDFEDRGTGKRITPDPTYKIGEGVVISLTDNFATTLVSSSSQVIPLGTLALSKTAEQAARASRVKNKELLKDVIDVEGKALDELDVELNLDNLGQDLLDKADKVQLTEDELDELERQEREKSIIKDHERDLKELEKLEEEISEAEASLNESKVDEDKFLEQQDLNFIEKKTSDPDADAFESLDDIETEVGLRYMDEDLNSRENPYGLTEFDLEEIDELLNTEQN